MCGKSLANTQPQKYKQHHICTLKYAERLRSAGIPEAHAKAEAEALRDVLSETVNSTIVTKAVLTSELAPIKAEMTKLDKELAVLKWMVGLVIAGVAAQLLKVFFA